MKCESKQQKEEMNDGITVEQNPMRYVSDCSIGIIAALEYVKSSWGEK